ncbi:hypothetical protein [Mariniradius sediminis]|uniref:DUF4190 domain-containing protein n=1 Tax=Mariniradius sediminis TaxID=2909237 RepID=A0ABS9BQ82_9BACT|nr:hypothetical protein [Mariniradius sediminis]MCF1749625.1 hypothetical protein [Mariniradius sediminis]
MDVAYILKIDFQLFFLLFFVGIFAFLVLLAPYFLLYLLHDWLRSKGLRHIGPTLAIGYTVFLLYSVYTAIYPTDDYFFNEFELVTLRETPLSAVVVRKEASYPDFHGDYCSAALLLLTEEDYRNLLDDLGDDQRFSKMAKGDYLGSFEFTAAMDTLSTDQIVQGFVRYTSGDENLYIGFLDDGKTVVISVCVT